MAKLIQAARGARLYTSEIGNRSVPMLIVQSETGKFAGVAVDAFAVRLAHTMEHDTEGAALSDLLAQLRNAQEPEVYRNGEYLGHGTNKPSAGVIDG